MALTLVKDIVGSHMGYDDCMKIDEMNVYPFCL